MTLLLVRHARAGRREQWQADDRLRPLSRRGERQAQALVPGLCKLLDKKSDVAVLSSPWVRCVQTVEPLAKALGVDVVQRIELGEGMAPKALHLLSEFADADAVLCTHGDIMEAALEMLARSGVDLGRRPEYPKGSTWVLQGTGKDFRSARYLAPPE